MFNLFIMGVIMEITDEMIKRKHKEFNDRISAVLNRTGGNQFSPRIERLRQLAQLRGR